MKELLDLHGIISVLNTPFNNDGTIEVDGLCRNVTEAIKAGVCGFLVPAMASEVDKLSESERDLLVRTVIEVVRNQASVNKVYVIGGASSPTAATRLRIGRHLIDLGCDGILVNIPYQDDVQYARDVRAVADLQPPFLMLQDWDATGDGIPVPLITKLFDEIDVFRCIKIEVVPAGVKYSAVLEATQGRLHVSGGWAVMQIIEALDRGVHAFMPTGMHPIYTQIYSLYHEGKRDQARTLFNRLAPVLAFSNQHLDISIHFFKRLLYQQGLYATPHVRNPILPFDAIHERTADELIEKVMEITESLGIRS